MVVSDQASSSVCATPSLSQLPSAFSCEDATTAWDPIMHAAGVQYWDQHGSLGTSRTGVYMTAILPLSADTHTKLTAANIANGSPTLMKQHLRAGSRGDGLPTECAKLWQLWQTIHLSNTARLYSVEHSATREAASEKQYDSKATRHAGTLQVVL